MFEEGQKVHVLGKGIIEAMGSHASPKIDPNEKYGGHIAYTGNDSKKYAVKFGDGFGDKKTPPTNAFNNVKRTDLLPITLKTIMVDCGHIEKPPAKTRGIPNAIIDRRGR